MEIKKLKYFKVQLGAFNYLIIQSRENKIELAKRLYSATGIEGPGGTIYNVKNYESLHELNGPDERMMRMALPIDRIF